MSQLLEKVEAEAMELPPRERAQLVRRLIASLDHADEEDPAEVERAWEEEIRRRLDEYRSGSAKTVPASEVFAKARAQLR
ncbi:MAG TPA: addiction module protein [Longimicrobiaceae bacterium]|nr:addiction module protein [Longimicrobiaceae bacterium]